MKIKEEQQLRDQAQLINAKQLRDMIQQVNVEIMELGNKKCELEEELEDLYGLYNNMFEG